MVSNKRKAIVTLLGGIALACVGNAVWELAVKPLGAYASDGILSIVTLGMDSLRDDLYAQGARRRNDHYSLLIVVGLFSLFVTASIMIGLSTLRRSSRSESPAATASQNDGRMQRMRRSMRVWGWASITFPVCFAFLMFTRSVYITEMGAAFNQRMTIIAPYITSQERLMLDSRFARIQTREDYIAVMSDLLDQYEQAGLKPFKINAF
ncbi:hypothetical protein LMG26686_02758 [Achromobacter mucicolens]|nr:hypothetical protein LMG26686_02758 [Achromobacter mucicolens]